MESNDILKLLPPVLLGFGGVLPFLIGTAGFYVRKEFQILLSIIFILIVWVGYLLALMSWEKMLFDDAYTVGGLIISLLLLLYVLYGGSGLIRSSETTADSVNGNPSPGDAATGKPTPGDVAREKPTSSIASGWLLGLKRFVFPSIETRRGYYLSIYCLAILAISLSAAMYVAPADRVVVTVNVPNDMCNINRVGAKMGTPGEQEEMRVKFKKSRGKAILMLTKDEFTHVTDFHIYSEDKKVALAKKSECRATLSADLGSRLEVDAAEQK